MKKSFTLFIIVALFFSFPNANAGSVTVLRNSSDMLLPPKKEGGDDVKGKMFITAGVGLNTIRASLFIKYGLSPLFVDSAKFDWYGNYGDGPSFTSTPMFHGIVDYGIGNKFTVGAGAGYQKATITGWEHADYNAASGTYYWSSYTDTWTRLNLGVRGLFHFVRKEKVSLYTGMRLGYNIYSHKTTYGDPFYFSKLNVKPWALSVQALFGFGFYFTKMIGMNSEVGLGVGGPYYFHIGLSCKLSK